MGKISPGTVSSGSSGGGSVTQGTIPWVVNITSVGGAAFALGQALATASLPVVLTAAQITTLTPPAAITNYALESGGNLATIAGKDFATQTTLAAINAKLVSGTDIGDVTINNGTGAAAVNIQDGGNSITVDGTVAFSNSTIAVTNAGTFVVQENGAALTALQLIDNIVSGAGANITQFAGVNAVTGSGTATGALRVELPTNGTGVIATVGAVTAITNALPAGTNAIGKLAANSGVDIGDIDASSATGSAVPTTAFYQGISDGTNLRGVLGAANSLNSTGAGLPTAQLVGQFDDTSPSSVTENQFANIRMNSARQLYAQTVMIDTLAASASLTITLASLANSTAGVGRQSTLITSNTARSAIITVKFTTGTTPTANSLVYIYLLRGDGTITDDGAGASDAGITIINAPLLGTILIPTNASNTTYYGVFDTKFLGSLGTTFGTALVNSSGATANGTGGNFDIRYTLIT